MAELQRQESYGVVFIVCGKGGRNEEAGVAFVLIYYTN